MIVTIAALGPTVGWGDGALVVGVMGVIVLGDGSADGVLVDGDGVLVDGDDAPADCP